MGYTFFNKNNFLYLVSLIQKKIIKFIGQQKLLIMDLHILIN